MAARDTGDVRIRLNGDRTAAQQYIGVARTQLGILKELMGFNNLPQLSRTVRLGNGTVIHCQSVFGQDTVTITLPAQGVEAVEEVVEAEEAVNRVADYVGVAMPNPVPYRGVSIGVVYKAPISVIITIPDDGTQSGYPKQIGASMGGEVLSTQDSYFNPSTGQYINAYNPYNGTITNCVSPGCTAESTVPVTTTAWWLAAVALGSGRDDLKPKTYVMASDGTVLASETYTDTAPYLRYTSDPSWSGGPIVNMFEQYNATYPDPSYVLYNHDLTFVVPEDCIYPAPAAIPPTYPGTDGNPTKWNADWAAGVAAFTARRKAWFLKNSTEVMAALKGKFQPGVAGVTRAELQTGSLPASWDYAIKVRIAKDYASFSLNDGSFAGQHTRMPIVMSITSDDDVVESDTSSDLALAGIKITRRTTTFSYIDADGASRTRTIDGRLTQIVTQHVLAGGGVDYSRNDAYSNWYVPTTAPSNEALIPHQFIHDRATYGVGLLWNGAIQQGYNDTSAYGVPGNPLTYATYTASYPAYSNTLVGTAPDIFLQYHNTVLPTYVSNTAQSSTVMNNSAMYHVKQVELKLFGPAPGGVPLGIFVDPTDADGATQLAYYGKALFSFDWFTGAIAPMGWAPHVNAQGKEVPLIIDMPAGYSYKNESGVLYFRRAGVNYTPAYNCALGYVWETPDEMWPDVAEYLRAKIKQLISGGGDQVLYKVILA